MRNGPRPFVSRANCDARDNEGDDRREIHRRSASVARPQPATVSFSREFYLLSNRYFHRLRGRAHSDDWDDRVALSSSRGLL